MLCLCPLNATTAVPVYRRMVLKCPSVSLRSSGLLSHEADRLGQYALVYVELASPNKDHKRSCHNMSNATLGRRYIRSFRKHWLLYRWVNRSASERLTQLLPEGREESLLDLKQNHEAEEVAVE